MNLTYFSSSDPTHKALSRDCNMGIEAVPALLGELEARGYGVEFVDISSVSEGNRGKHYKCLVLPAAHKHYEIRKMFGTNQYSACWFGAEVPALHVIDTDLVGDTYPHKKGTRITTIHDFLTGLLAA
jgi:hypothetical protein